MAKTVVFYFDTGATVTADVLSRTGSSSYLTNQDCTEVTGTGIYSFTTSSTLNGQDDYQVNIRIGGVLVGSTFFSVIATDGTFICDTPTLGQIKAELSAPTVDIINSIVINSEEARGSLVPGQITCIIGDTLNPTLSIGTFTGYSKIIISVKSSPEIPTEDATIVFDSSIGLVTFQGEAATDASLSSLQSIDAAAGTLVWYLDASLTELLVPDSLVYSVRTILSGTNRSPILNKPFVIVRSTNEIIA